MFVEKTVQIRLFLIDKLIVATAIIVFSRFQYTHKVEIEWLTIDLRKKKRKKKVTGDSEKEKKSEKFQCLWQRETWKRF